MEQVANFWIWAGFSIFVIIALGIDTWLAEKKQIGPQSSVRASLYWTLFWVVLALIFNLLLWGYLYVTNGPVFAHQSALDFLTGYLIEKSLSVDNLFVFYMIFHQFRIPVALQRRVFSYGIWSAVVFRLLFILLGTYLIAQFHWLLYLLGVFLMLTGIKMFFFETKEKDLAQGILFRLLNRIFRLTDEIAEQHFFVKREGYYFATRLFVALAFVEISDIIFAFDSIPAIFAITRDPFIVWTSNIFAILGLRALYFCLAGMADRFNLLKYGVAIILIFVGFKMVIEPWFNVPTVFSLGIVIGILLSFIFVSLFRERKNNAAN